MSNDPNEFEAPKRMRRLPLYIVLGAAIILFGVLVYSVNFSGNQKKEEPPKIPVTSKDDKPLINDAGGQGLAVAPPLAPVEKKETPIPPITVITNPDSPELTREKEELRRRRHQAALNALSSPMVVRKGKDESPANGNKAAPPVNLAASTTESERRAEVLERLTGQAGSREGGYDPAADKDKEAFFDRTRAKDSQWLSSSTRMAGQRFEVKTSSVIPATMVGGINSDLPGQIIAQVSRNVFDTATGRYLLIPQGSRLFGVYDSRIIYGQSRVLVAWNRIIFPDGSAITLESMPGTDGAGYSGFNDEVNNHYFRIFGNALLMTLITGGTAWAVDSVTPQNSTSLTSNSSPTLQQQMASSLSTQLGQTTSQMLAKNMNIKPTLEIRPGYSFNVIVTKDLAFKEPYRDSQ